MTRQRVNLNAAEHDSEHNGYESGAKEQLLYLTMNLQFISNFNDKTRIPYTLSLSLTL